MTYRIQPSDTLFRYVKKPTEGVERIREFNVFGDWWRVNVLSNVEKYPGVYGLKMTRSYFVKMDKEGSLQFHHTTPAEEMST